MPSHYPALAEAVVAALPKTIGTTAEGEALWIRLYADAARLMIEGES